MMFRRSRSSLHGAFWAFSLGLIAACALYLGGAAPSQAATESKIVTEARLGVHGARTRFVIELTAKVPYEISFLTGPDRLVIELPGLSWHVRKGGTMAGGLVSRYRFSSLPPDKSHIVLELTRPSGVKNVGFLSPQDGHDWRLVVDVEAISRPAFQKLAANTASAGQEPAKPAQKEPETVQIDVPPPSPATPEIAGVELPKLTAPPVPFDDALLATPAPQTVPQPAPKAPEVAALPDSPSILPEKSPSPGPVLPAAPLQKRVVVIDPGHGGIDPGAQAEDGTKEKDVVFKVAQEVAKSLEKTGRYKAILTRDSDVFLKLSERVEIARQAGADLFISLHADVLADAPDVSGAAVYTLSEKASDKEAEVLASKENRADIIAGVDLSHESDDVTYILIDLAQRETMSRSAQFAHVAEDAVEPFTPMVKNTTRQAGFRVLKAPDVPAVLIELGYLSNADDLARITSDRWIGQFAQAMVLAADRQFHLSDTKRADHAERASLE